MKMVVVMETDARDNLVTNFVSAREIIQGGQRVWRGFSEGLFRCVSLV